MNVFWRFSCFLNLLPYMQQRWIEKGTWAKHLYDKGCFDRRESSKWQWKCKSPEVDTDNAIIIRGPLFFLLLNFDSKCSNSCFYWHCHFKRRSPFLFFSEFYQWSIHFWPFYVIQELDKKVVNCWESRWRLATAIRNFQSNFSLEILSGHSKKEFPWRLVTLETCNHEEVDTLTDVNTLENDDMNYSSSNYSNPT